MKLKKIKLPSDTMSKVEEDWKDCEQCEIGKKVRNHVFLDVIPEGIEPVNLDFLFIGEGPGQVEDIKGLPFVGPAGKLLRDAIEESNPYCRSCDGSGYDDGNNEKCHWCKGKGCVTIGLTNLISCRPYVTKPTATGNREPSIIEVENCLPRLVRMIKVLNPDTIVLLGKEAQGYLSIIRSDTNFKGQFVCMKHPSFMLRQGGKDSGLLWKQYKDQLISYFTHQFDINQVSYLQYIGRLQK